MFMDNRELMAQARTQLRGKWGVAVATFLVYLIISCIPGAIPVVGWIASFVISGPILVGLHIFSLAIVRGKELKTGQLFDAFPFFVNGLVAYILVMILILLWTLLFLVPGIILGTLYFLTPSIMADVSVSILVIIFIFAILCTLLLSVPGIMAAFSYSMTFFILADNMQLDGLEAIRRSKAMMNGHKWRLSCLIGRFTGWIILGVLTLLIGFLWIGPYIMVSLAQFYEDIRGAEHVVQQPELAITPGS
jgi:uncharacterized membrane protein